MMKRTTITIGFLAALALAALVAAGQLGTRGTAPVQVTVHAVTGASAPGTLRQDMRKLWSDHVIWTRDYVVAAVGDQPDQQAAANRLMKNQEDLGAAVAVYYGKPAGDELTDLLKQHISIAVDVIKSAKAGDKSAQQLADIRWHRNGEEIADFLSKANANWPRAALVDMMNKHLSTTTSEVVARLNKNWDDDVRAFDAVYQHIVMMSDVLSDGIIKQFPQRFSPKLTTTH
jgi:hypothetical protein